MRKKGLLFWGGPNLVALCGLMFMSPTTGVLLFHVSRIWDCTDCTDCMEWKDSSRKKREKTGQRGKDWVELTK